MAGTWGTSLKIGEEFPDKNERGKNDAWEGEYKNGLYEGSNGGLGHG